MKLLITGSNGFIGKNLIAILKHIKEGKDKSRFFEISEIYTYDRSKTTEDLKEYTKDCDFVIHLAGVNRPQNTSDFYNGNTVFTSDLCSCLKAAGNTCPILFSSSIQVGKENDYARSKEESEITLQRFSAEHGNKIFIYRFTNLYGKWCKPNYNSVIATWCYNIARGIDININDKSAVLPLCYIGDVVQEILNCIEGKPLYDKDNDYFTVYPIYKVSLDKLQNLLISFKDSRENLYMVHQDDDFTKKLYATYLSYLPQGDFAYPLKMNIDDRGSFTEFIKTKEYGQVSVNISHPGVIKGEHWHETKNEKFLVVAGTGIIKLRDMSQEKGDIIEYHVSGKQLVVIDIPVGYTHNIINLGDTDMVTIMWANELFDFVKPDTYFDKVVQGE